MAKASPEFEGVALRVPLFELALIELGHPLELVRHAVSVHSRELYGVRGGDWDIQELDVERADIVQHGALSLELLRREQLPVAVEQLNSWRIGAPEEVACLCMGGAYQLTQREYGPRA